MAIGYEDLVAAFPEALRYQEDKAAPFIEVANHGFPDSRFEVASMADRGRTLYVMHMLTKPALDLQAPYILAQMGAQKPWGKKPGVWDDTEYGLALKNIVLL